MFYLLRIFTCYMCHYPTTVRVRNASLCFFPFCPRIYSFCCLARAFNNALSSLQAMTTNKPLFFTLSVHPHQSLEAYFPLSLLTASCFSLVSPSLLPHSCQKLLIEHTDYTTPRFDIANSSLVPAWLNSNPAFLKKVQFRWVSYVYVTSPQNRFKNDFIVRHEGDDYNHNTWKAEEWELRDQGQLEITLSLWARRYFNLYWL